MALLSELRPRGGSKQRRKLLGRGHSAGCGGTAGKGHKGQKARTGGRVRWGFEGGQVPLSRRLPKFGFTNRSFQEEFSIVNVGDLNSFKSGSVDPESLKASGKIKGGLVKILGKGEIKVALSVKAHKFSKKAESLITAAGGKVEVIS